MFSLFLCCRNFPCEKMIHLFSVFITPHCLKSFVFLWEFRHFHYEWPLYWTTYTIFRFYSWTFRSIYYLINNKHVFKAKRFKVRERESYKWWFHSRCLWAWAVFRLNQVDKFRCGIPFLNPFVDSCIHLFEILRICRTVFRSMNMNGSKIKNLKSALEGILQISTLCSILGKVKHQGKKFRKIPKTLRHALSENSFS